MSRFKLKPDPIRERDHQATVIAWRDSAAGSGRWPELGLLFSIGNYQRHGYKMYQYRVGQGLQPGVPDLCLPVARGPYHGLYIEMKRDKSKPTDAQKVWLEALARQGYMTAVCYSAQEAIDVLITYMSYGDFYDWTKTA